MTPQPRLTGKPIMRILCQKTNTLVGYLYQWNNGDVQPAWLNEAMADVRYEPMVEAARVLAGTDDFQTVYRQRRPMIERTIAWLVKDNHRRLRYRGIERNQLGWSHRCAAVNLKRLLALGLTHDNGWTITPAA